MQAFQSICSKFWEWQLKYYVFYNPIYILVLQPQERTTHCRRWMNTVDIFIQKSVMTTISQVFVLSTGKGNDLFTKNLS